MPFIPLAVAAVSAGASIYSSNQQASAAKSAAAGQQAATDQAIAADTAARDKASGIDQAQYDTTAASLQPYTSAGVSALDQLTQELKTQPQYASFNFGAEPDYGKLDISADAYKESPGLTTSLTRGISDLNSQYAAKGLIGSGAAAKAIADYATGTRMNDYNTWAGQQTSQYNADRNFLQSDYQNNRNFAYQDYTNTQNRDISQRNNLLQSLYSIAGLGGQANGQLTSAGNTNAAAQSSLLTGGATNQGNLLTSNATSQGQSLVAGTNADASGLNTATGYLTSALNKFGTSYKAPAAANTNGPAPTDISGVRTVF